MRKKGKKYRRLWKQKHKTGEVPISYKEAKALKKAIAEKFRRKIE